MGESTRVNSWFEPGDLHAFFIGIDPGLGLIGDRLVLINLLRADRAGPDQVDGPVTGKGCPGQLELGLIEIDLALGLVELGFVGPAINHEQQVSFLHLGPFLKRHLDQVAGDHGDDVHGLNGLGLAGKVDVVGDFPAKSAWLTGSTGGLAGTGFGRLGLGLRRFLIGHDRLAEHRHRHPLRPDQHSRPDLQEGAADDPFVRLQPVFDHPQVVVLERTGSDPAGLNLVVGIEHVDVLQPLIRRNRSISHQERPVRQADRQADSARTYRARSVAGPPWAAGSGIQLAAEWCPSLHCSGC